MKKSLFALLCSMAGLASCMGGSDYYRDRVMPFLEALRPNYQPQVFDGVLEPAEFPDLEEDQKTLIGIDSNKDGVRDDMEIFINRNFKYDYEREQLKADFKRAPHYFKNYKTMNPDEKIRVESNHFEELSCINYAYEGLKLPMSPEISRYSGISALFNTKLRREAHNYDYQALAGKAYGDGHGDKHIFPDCIKKLENKYKIKK